MSYMLVEALNIQKDPHPISILIDGNYNVKGKKYTGWN